ncbi:S1 RNA-binding domain-containing protein [Candidatus Woesearchaeota archaeon]|nr:S1 RNA-binding domain-containing protein [Candidatus Woesearchaeota archaeon]
MLFEKTGYPEEGDIIFCTVTKIHFHSVFVTLDEYRGKQGMIHISEVSPGRIRNLGDYVKEGKVIICKVLKINKERGHIDLSLRRVNESQRRAKIEERKQQAIAENILQSYIQLHKGDIKELYKTVAQKVLEHYETIYAAFEDVVENEAKLSDTGLDTKLSQDIEKFVRERIKQKQVEIIGELAIESYAKNGAELVNNFMKKIVAISELLHVQFLGSGKFKIEVRAREYKVAEAVIAQLEEEVTTVTSKETICTFERV